LTIIVTYRRATIGNDDCLNIQVRTLLNPESGSFSPLYLGEVKGLERHCHFVLQLTAFSKICYPSLGYHFNFLRQPYPLSDYWSTSNRVKYFRPSFLCNKDNFTLA
jgi:hypothetical protein